MDVWWTDEHRWNKDVMGTVYVDMGTPISLSHVIGVTYVARGFSGVKSMGSIADVGRMS